MIVAHLGRDPQWASAVDSAHIRIGTFGEQRHQGGPVPVLRRDEYRRGSVLQLESWGTRKAKMSEQFLRRNA